jgi:hypothetical protein
METGHTSAYFAHRSGKKKSYYSKLTAVCDTSSHLFTAAVADRGPLPDDVEFKEVLLMASRVFPFDELLADAGYDSEANHTFIRDTIGANSIIPPLRGRPVNGPPRGARRRQMYLNFPKARYGQRAQIESAFSQNKRRFGSEIRARKIETQQIEALMRAIVHNIALVSDP